MEQWRKVSQTHDEGGLRKALLESMFWLKPKDSAIKLLVDSETVEAEVLAALPGAAFVQIGDESGKGPSWHKKVDRQVAKRFPERILVFRGSKEDSWYWPKKLSSGTVSYERLLAKPFSLPDYLAQRLAGLSFEASDHNNPAVMNPTSVREKIRGQFQSAQITENFYKTFKKKHEMLSSKIVGLSDESASSSYATVLLNRLMFVYFLQKKEFLNGDPHYLRTCLSRLKQARGENKFYSFYRDYLLEFFFNKLDKSGGVLSDPFLEEIAGDIPYINGGVFGETHVEKENSIEIPDEAFEEIFNFFDSYTWHLDTRPTGNSNEINPEVIGYIFEQYINETSSGKKDKGAYYTKADVTGYMVAQTLLPRIVSELLELSPSVFDLIKKNPLRYVRESLMQGYDFESQAWKSAPDGLKQCWLSDPIGWHLLDQTETDKELCLEGETWVEAFNRREKVSSLMLDCSGGGVCSVDDLVSKNLDTQKLIIDVIALLDKEAIENLWERISRLSILDPTCGSGAFLFTAMELLEQVYASLLDRLEDLDMTSELILSAESHPNRRYFLRKHIALRNLYGVDIMEDAIETAKLRIFLALASCLESRSEMEPLPDLEFNLRTGNLVVGFVDSTDVARVSDGKLIIENRLADLEGSMKSHLALFEDFIHASEENLPNSPALRNEFLKSEIKLRNIADNYYAECRDQTVDEYQAWSEINKPFHWSVEFPEVFSRGGFDVIVGNPPYIRKSDIPPETKKSLVGFATSNTPDFYAVCLERTFNLLGEKGRRAMVVMSSFVFGNSFREARNLYFDEGHPRSVWVSTFGLLPDGLFTSSKASVRNTIILDRQAAYPNYMATSHQIFSSQRRGWLFDSLSYGKAFIQSDKSIIRAGECSGLFEVGSSANPPTAQSGEVIYMRGTGRYWFPVLSTIPPVFDEDLEVSEEQDAGVNKINLLSGENAGLTLAVLASKIGYLHWSAVGDDFHVLASQTHGVRALAATFKPSDNLLDMAKVVIEEAQAHWFATKNSNRYYCNIRWTSVGQSMEVFTREFLREAGLSEYWRPISVWYRQTMRSTGDSKKAVSVPESILATLTKSSLALYTPE